MTTTAGPRRQFGRLFTICLCALFMVIAAFVLYVWSEKRIDHANELRYASHGLVEELRQSSDDLTRMARTYAVTGEARYLRHFHEIIDIRDGRAPRPESYDNVYWDLVFDGARPRPAGGAVPLLELMRQAHFTPSEMALLAQAKNESDHLSVIELKALAMRDAAQGDARAVDAAVTLLHDADYHRAKAAIMRPIMEVNASVNQRTRLAVEATAFDATAARMLFILFALVLVLWLWRAKRSLDRALGCSVDQLHDGIARLGRGDFAEALPGAGGAGDSVWGWLGGMQQSLAWLDAERREALTRTQRVSRLYSALSQCNQAIIRARNEEELFAGICRNVVNHGGMTMAWIGLIDAERTTVRPAASFGRGTDYVDNLVVSLDPDSPLSQGPIGLAFHSGQAFWCQNFQQAPELAPWREYGARYGWAASAAIPLRSKEGIIGFFLPYSDTLDAFDVEARELLLEMASDIEFALKNFASEAVRVQADARIQYLAHFDVLTGLPNRTQLDEHATQALAKAHRNQDTMALMMLDLDHFKDINDSLGHTVGDTLLCELATRLRLCLREDDLVARLGGDEFIFVLPQVDAKGAAEVAAKLLELTGQPYRVGLHDLKVTASIGIAMYPADGGDMETLLQRADAAMYQVKRAGRHDFRFFTAVMQQRAARHLQLVNALRYALEREQLQVVYQPQLALPERRIIGAEALLRWSTPELGAVSPAEFIPAAEESGLIMAIGSWVLREAVRQARAWLDAGLPPLIMSVNLSAMQFRNTGLPQLISQILQEEGLPPEYLELELTEGVAAHDPQGAIAMMNALHDRGVRMSIDDFGTGFSSLSHLKKFKVYKLKIDQSFVRDISTDAEDKAIVSAIINMARSLGLKTIAEGVETAEQLAFLVDQQCDEMQGYYFSKPVGEADFRALVLGANASLRAR